MSNNKPFVKSNLLKYKSHNTISIPKEFIRNNVQQGDCLTQSLQIWTWPSTQITLFERTRQSAWLDAVTTLLIRSEWILVYSNTSFWKDLSNQKYCQKTPEMLSPTRYWCHVFKISRLMPQKNITLRSFNWWINSNQFGAKDSEKLFSSLGFSSP